jgi:hypothetical protein
MEPTAESSKVPLPPANTLVIRLWRVASRRRGQWRGRIEHIQSGNSERFSSGQELLGLLKDWVGFDQT